MAPVSFILLYIILLDNYCCCIHLQLVFTSYNWRVELIYIISHRLLLGSLICLIIAFPKINMCFAHKIQSQSGDVQVSAREQPSLCRQQKHAFRSPRTAALLSG